MKLFIPLVAVFVCKIAVMQADPTTCNSCLADAGNGDDIAMCNSMQVPFACSNMTFPNVGSTHCYTAAGWYSQSDMWMTGVVRGCMNCTDMAAAIEKLKMDFATSRNWTISDAFKIECCDTNNCNNQNVTAPQSPNATQPGVVSSTAPSPTMTPTGPPDPTANANRLFPISGILAFARIIIDVFLLF